MERMPFNGLWQSFDQLFHYVSPTTLRILSIQRRYHLMMYNDGAWLASGRAHRACWSFSERLKLQRTFVAWHRDKELKMPNNLFDNELQPDRVCCIFREYLITGSTALNVPKLSTSGAAPDLIMAVSQTSVECCRTCRWGGIFGEGMVARVEADEN